MVELSPSKGRLLIADPSMSDNSFGRAVIYLAEHNKNGSVGFIMNKPLGFKLNEIIADVDCSAEVYNGGPVDQDNLFFIHQSPDIIPNSIEINNGIYWGGDFGVLKELLNNKKINPYTIRFFLGYSGWSYKQLMDELKENSWVISKEVGDAQFLDVKSNKMWSNQMRRLGGEYLIWANSPSDPALN